MEVLAVIMARAGSVGVPGKSRRELLGRPVIAYTFDQVRAAQRINRCVVSSDDQMILELARSAGFEVIERPPELATSTSATDPVLRHAVRTMAERHRYAPEAVVMLYGNVPLRRHQMIDKCIAMLEETGADSVQTIAPVGKNHPYWMFDLTPDANGDSVGTGGKITKHIPNQIFRRQDLPPLYAPTGAVYVMKTQVLMAGEGQADPHAFLGRDRRGLITAVEDSVDIDVPRDFFLAEAILRSEQTPLP